jgi:hypothetical protein
VASITRDTGVKHHLRQRLLSARVGAVAGNVGAAARENLLYELKAAFGRGGCARLAALAVLAGQHRDHQDPEGFNAQRRGDQLADRAAVGAASNGRHRGRRVRGGPSRDRRASGRAQPAHR